ncbi:DUF1836 domain-containing protein [Limosilactobacillus kribbianus]|uniref:DUF1836 domain-containing protein n=1 Tax=Limosilactobacillus kribbianus TaxID=2982695 RepID=UPI002263CB62|nr:DUF1836 domain-containing protein [Limosilactobacillus kribbianus]
MEKTEQNPAAMDLHLPRYAELPRLGLYLEQAVEYVNENLAALGDVRLTSAMASSYVKHHLLSHPQRRQYGRDHLARLVFIAAAKNVLPLASLRVAVEIQQGSRESFASAYDCFCTELENAVRVAMHRQIPEEVIAVETDQQKMLHNLALAIAYRSVVDRYFHTISADL